MMGKLVWLSFSVLFLATKMTSASLFLLSHLLSAVFCVDLLTAALSPEESALERDWPGKRAAREAPNWDMLLTPPCTADQPTPPLATTMNQQPPNPLYLPQQEAKTSVDTPPTCP